MKKLILITTVLFALIFASFQEKNNNELNGKSFVGFEHDKYTHGESPTYQTTLTFKNDSVLVNRNIITITNKDTLNFKKEKDSYQYKGIVKKEKNNIEFLADAYKCDNCEFLTSVDEVDENGEPKEFLESKIYKGYFTKNGLKLNGFIFKPFSQKETKK